MVCLAGSLPMLAGEAKLQRHLDLEYKKVDGKSLLLNLFVPESKDAAALPPLIVHVHGGGWKGGQPLREPQKPFVENGFAVASIRYSYAPEAVFPAQVRDCNSAIKFLRANAAKYGYNAQKIGIVGESAGGHLVAMMGVTDGLEEFQHPDDDYADASSRVQAVCNMFGVTDFKAMLHFTQKLEEIMAAETEEEGKALADQFCDMPDYYKVVHILTKNGKPEDSLKATMDTLFGEKIEGNPAKLVSFSPLSYVNGPLKRDPAVFPPFLTLHAVGDPIVPLAQGKVFDEALRSVGAESGIITYDRVGHSATPEKLTAAMEFFTRHLKQ